MFYHTVIFGDFKLMLIIYCYTFRPAAYCTFNAVTVLTAVLKHPCSESYTRKACVVDKFSLHFQI
jgi:hypothetical protein